MENEVIDFSQYTIALIELGFSFEDLAKLADTSPITIRRIARGQTKNPAYETGTQLVRLYRRMVLKEHAGRPADIEKLRGQ